MATFYLNLFLLFTIMSYGEWAVNSEEDIFVQNLFAGGQLSGNESEMSIEVAAVANSYGLEFQKASECGGLVEGPAGVINYKVGVNLTEEETCVWTVYVPKKETIQIHLVTDGFYNYYQAITIYTSSNPTRYQFTKSFGIDGMDRNVYNVSGGSLIQVVFGAQDSRQFGVATGFSLLLEGIGPDSNETDSRVPTFKVFDIAPGTSEGVIEYTEAAAGSFSEGEFVSATIHPADGKTIAATLEYVVSNPRGPCMYNTIFWYDTVRIEEMNMYGDSTIRFQECKTTWYNTTIYSNYPLTLTMYSIIGRGRSFGLSWTMI